MSEFLVLEKSDMNKGDYTFFNTKFNAVQACLEVLGWPKNVLMAVTTPVEIASAVHRAGSQAIILDIDDAFKQINAQQVRDVQEELKEPLVILVHRNFWHSPINPELKKICETETMILVNWFPPTDNAANHGHFNIFCDGVPLSDRASSVYTQYEEQRAQLKDIATGDAGTFSAGERWCSYYGVEEYEVQRHLLHKNPSWAKRWVAEPSYPVAESFYDKK